VSVLDDSINVVSGLAWNLLSTSDSDIRNESTLEVLLEELPDQFLASLNLIRENWGYPDRLIESVLLQVLQFLEGINIQTKT
jgi:hypothetical protein